MTTNQVNLDVSQNWYKPSETLDRLLRAADGGSEPRSLFLLGLLHHRLTVPERRTGRGYFGLVE